jgi:hypothetical protein
VRKISVQGLFYSIGKNKYFSLDPRLRNFSFSSHPQPTSAYANAAFFQQNPTIPMYSSQDSKRPKESGRATPTQVRWEYNWSTGQYTLAVCTAATGAGGFGNDIGLNHTADRAELSVLLSTPSPKPVR